MASKLLVLLGILATVMAQTSARVFYVDSSLQNGHKRDESSFERTFGKIQDCIDALEGPGDECVIRSGRYHESVSITGKHGSKENPIIIRGDSDAQTKLDGTVPLTPSKWEEHGNGIYKAVIEQDIWQLFIDEEMMTNARWPNSLWSNKTIFLNDYWGKSARTSKRGLMIDDGSLDLAGSGLDAKGAMAVLNVGSFNTFTREVLTHGAGSDRFTYKDDFGDPLNFKPKNNQYFFEDKLELLDNLGEWFYNQTTRTLYVKTLDGGSPAGRNVRGKVQSLAFTITNCAHVIFKDLTFFATTLQARSIDNSNFIDDLTFHSLNFSFPSYSRRMLRDTRPPEWTKVLAVSRKSGRHTVKFYNNTFYGTDGVALEFGGVNVTLENNLFEYNDWSSANMQKAIGGLGTVVSQGVADKFVRNTLRFNGASVGYRSGLKSTALLNDISQQCWGMIQHDGAGVQVTVKRQTDAVLQQNWVHSSPKYGLRFDGGPPKIGYDGTMRQNVLRKTNGMMVKGDRHKVLNNLVFHKFTKAGDHDGQGSKCNLCVLEYVRKNPIAINHDTVVKFNAADIANGGVHNDTLYPMAGHVEDNVIGNVRQQLMDPDNMDFRPRADSAYNAKNVGPYNYETTKTHYWIPGRVMYKASNPVPPDGSTEIKADARDALMWLNAYQATAHFVSLGTSPDDLRRVATVRNGRNVASPRKPLESGTKYFWRVDARISKNVFYKGDVWSFTTI